jgi:hypothetical protein
MLQERGCHLHPALLDPWETQVIPVMKILQYDSAASKRGSLGSVVVWQKTDGATSNFCSSKLYTAECSEMTEAVTHPSQAIPMADPKLETFFGFYFL